MAADQAATGLKDYTLAFLTRSPAAPRSGRTAARRRRLRLADQCHAGLRRQRHHLLRRRVRRRARADLHQRLAAHRRLPERGQHLRRHPAGLRHRGRRAVRYRRHPRRDQALAALQAEDPSVQVDFTLAVAPNGLPTGTGSEYALLQDAKAKGVKVSTVNIMTMDFGAGSNELADAESAAQADREPARRPVRDLHLGRLRDDGPDTDRGHQRRRHRLLHRQRPVAGELRRVQRRPGALLLGGRRLRQGHRLPVLVDLQPDHRRRRRHPPPTWLGSDHRLPGPVPG